MMTVMHNSCLLKKPISLKIRSVWHIIYLAWDSSKCIGV